MRWAHSPSKMNIPILVKYVAFIMEVNLTNDTVWCYCRPFVALCASPLTKVKVLWSVDTMSYTRDNLLQSTGAAAHAYHPTSRVTAHSAMASLKRKQSYVS